MQALCFLCFFMVVKVSKNLVGAEVALLLHHLLLFLLQLLVDLGAFAGLVAVVLGLERLLVNCKA